MPIKFHCEQCGQKIRVSSKQAGNRSKCPKCKARLVVPSESSEAGEVEPPASDDVAAGPENPYAEFVVYDDEVEWVYEDDGPRAEPGIAAATDIHRVAVPRNVLYMQGALLAIVAIIAFILGVMVGSGSQPTEVAVRPPKPCVVSGKVMYRSGGGRQRPDDGSVLLVVPTDDHPAATSKARIEGLRPGDPMPRDDSDNLRIIESIGGSYVRADADGQFEIRLPDVGKYFVLVVSKNAYRGPGEELNKIDIAELGRYVQPPTELLGNSKYKWQEVTLHNNRKLDFTF